MAIDLMAEDDGDDGDWNICWDFERNDWGSGWKSASASSWGPTGVPAWQVPTGSLAGDGPFAGDAGASMSPVSTRPWWTQPVVSTVSGDGPYMGDGDAGAPRPVRLTELPAALPFQGLIPPPPPPGPPFGALPEADVPRASQASRGGAAGGKKLKKRKEPRERRGLDGGREDDIAREIEALLNRPGANLQKADFDSGVRRYLGALRGCQNGPQKVKDAMEMLHTYTSQKSRAAVKNWPAYLLTLLKRFEPGALNPKRQTDGQGPKRAEGDDKREAITAPGGEPSGDGDTALDVDAEAENLPEPCAQPGHDAEPTSEQKPPSEETIGIISSRTVPTQIPALHKLESPRKRPNYAGEHI